MIRSWTAPVRLCPGRYGEEGRNAAYDRQGKQVEGRVKIAELHALGVEQEGSVVEDRNEDQLALNALPQALSCCLYFEEHEQQCNEQDEPGPERNAGLFDGNTVGPCEAVAHAGVGHAELLSPFPAVVFPFLEVQAGMYAQGVACECKLCPDA